MMAAVEIPVARVLHATAGTRVSGDGEAQFSSLTIDSRAVEPGGLFVAVKGDRFDGHDFASTAIAAGARGVVIGRGRGLTLPSDAVVIEVDDTVKALGAIGRAQRDAIPGL